MLIPMHHGMAEHEEKGVESREFGWATYQGEQQCCELNGEKNLHMGFGEN